MLLEIEKKPGGWNRIKVFTLLKFQNEIPGSQMVIIGWPSNDYPSKSTQFKQFYGKLQLRTCEVISRKPAGDADLKMSTLPAISFHTFLSQAPVGRKQPSLLLHIRISRELSEDLHRVFSSCSTCCSMLLLTSGSHWFLVISTIYFNTQNYQSVVPTWPVIPASTAAFEPS